MQQTSRADPRFRNQTPIRLVIAAVYATSREIDQGIGTFEVRDPIAKREAVPRSRPPFLGVRMTADNGHLMTLFLEMARQYAADLPCPARYHDSHRLSP
jgi:hypothetical protein